MVNASGMFPGRVRRRAGLARGRVQHRAKLARGRVRPRPKYGILAMLKPKRGHTADVKHRKLRNSASQAFLDGHKSKCLFLNLISIQASRSSKLFL